MKIVKPKTLKFPILVQCLKRSLKSYVSVKSVGHQFKFPIWRNERNSAIILKSGQTHTLVKFHIFQLDCLAFASCKEKYNYKSCI